MATKFAEKFWTIYDEVYLINGELAKGKDLIGKPFVVITEKDRASYDFEEVGVMYIIKFDDGRLAEAFPEEVEIELQR